MAKTKKQIEYAQKFKDPRWQKKRLKILERDDFECQICYDRESTLHIHHRYYIKDREPWDYEDEAFATLCEDCHDDESRSIKPVMDSFIGLVKTRFFSNEIIDISWGLHEAKFVHATEVVASAIAYMLTNEEIQRIVIKAFFDSLKKDI